MKVWISKYALTASGIFEVDVIHGPDATGWVRTNAPPGHLISYPPGDWHESRAEAMTVARCWRAIEIQKHRDRITELEALTFEE